VSRTQVSFHYRVGTVLHTRELELHIAGVVNSGLSYIHSIIAKLNSILGGVTASFGAFERASFIPNREVSAASAET